MIMQLLGNVVGFGLVFVILFVIVEYIGFLKLFPEKKYIGSWLVGVVFLAYIVWNMKPSKTIVGNGTMAVVIASGLALWYAVDGARKGRELLDRSEKKPDTVDSSESEEEPIS